jgi:hypothetical protein
MKKVNIIKFIGDKMKSIQKIFFIIVMVFFSRFSFAQDISVQNLIGKQKSDVINIYGNPVHVDDSTPSMICLFYKIPNMTVVLDETGVYQAEITKVYQNEQDRKKDLDQLIQTSINSGFESDTVTTENIILKKVGVQTDIELAKGPKPEDFGLKIKAVRYVE